MVELKYSVRSIAQGCFYLSKSKLSGFNQTFFSFSLVCRGDIFKVNVVKFVLDQQEVTTPSKDRDGNKLGIDTGVWLNICK